MQFISSWLQFKNSFAVETGQLHIICGTRFPHDQWYVQLPCTSTTVLQTMNLGFWSIRCRDRFLHKSSMFWADWCGHHFGGPFQHLHSVCATCWHDTFAVHHHATATATGSNFDAGSIIRAWKGNRTAKFLAWPSFQCRCSCTSTYPLNIVSLTDACAIDCKSALLDLLSPTEKQNSWLTQTLEARETSL